MHWFMRDKPRVQYDWRDELDDYYHSSVQWVHHGCSDGSTDLLLDNIDESTVDNQHFCDMVKFIMSQPRMSCEEFGRRLNEGY